MEKIIVGCLAIIVAILLTIGLYVFGGVILVWAWNMTLPVLFHFPLINFWQAIGILILLDILRRALSVTISKA